MKYAKYLGIAAVLSMFLMAAPAANAQVAVGVNIGAPVVVAPPVCTWGYYPYYPYACVPYGYYGPNWFVGGVFIGAGPWFHPYHGFVYTRPGYAHIQPYPYRGGAVVGRPGYVAPRGGAVVAPRGSVNTFHGTAPVGRAPVANSFRGGSNVGGFHGTTGAAGFRGGANNAAGFHGSAAGFHGGVGGFHGGGGRR